MIRLSQPPRARQDSVVPMINVAFLLLVFFLMTAVIVPPEPLEVSPPEASTEADDVTQNVLVITAEGELALGQLRGEAVFDALGDGALHVRADAGLEGTDLARILARLSEKGVTEVELVTVPR